MIYKEVWLGDQVLKEIETRAAEALLLGANEMASDIKSFTPVQTGNLRSKIQPEGKVIVTPSSITTKITSGDVEYAEHVEYGTSKMSPRAMFRKGAVSAKPKIDSIIKRKLKM